jgi:ATP phosphoribosyltransferase
MDAIDTMLGAVIAARGKKYLMMNAPASRLADLEGLLPGLESPSVIPLAHEGMIAIHSVVGADEVWGLLPKLKAGGASGILILPIEKIVP